MWLRVLARILCHQRMKLTCGMHTQLMELACLKVSILRYDRLRSDLVPSYLGVMLGVAQHCFSITGPVSPVNQGKSSDARHEHFLAIHHMTTVRTPRLRKRASPEYSSEVCGVVFDA